MPSGDGCYRSDVAKIEQHGLDLVETRRRLEDWWLENVSYPVGDGVTYWPGGRSESIRNLLLQHWGEHGVGDLVEHDGVLYSALRCLDAYCPVLGVALALLEICAYEETSIELDEIEWLRQAESRLWYSDPLRTVLLARAEQLTVGLVSRAVENRTPGRHRRMLAQAVAQHLRAGGLSYGSIAQLMAAAVDATRRRCKVQSVRSLAAVVSSP